MEKKNGFVVRRGETGSASVLFLALQHDGGSDHHNGRLRVKLSLLALKRCHEIPPPRYTNPDPAHRTLSSHYIAPSHPGRLGAWWGGLQTS